MFGVFCGEGRAGRGMHWGIDGEGVGGQQWGGEGKTARWGRGWGQ